jgi:hypothetical protein
MRKVRKAIQLSLFVLGLLFSVKGVEAQNISNHFFGQNAWMPDTIGNIHTAPEPPVVYYGKLHKNWGNIQASKSSIIRFGGIGADKNMPTNFQYIKMIDSIRAKGMEPVIQVPFHNWRYNAQQAADIVKFINGTNGKNVKYWSIGNEPDLGYGYTTSAQVAAYIRSFSSAMKSVDPSILIMGPETAWFNYPIITGLTTPGGPDDVTGKDANGRYYLDIISFHTYPFDGSQTRSQVMTKLTSSGSLQDNLVYLNSQISKCNLAHGRTGNYALRSAITEANIDWQNNSGDNLWGSGASSFIGGQFWAEMMSIALKNGVDFINFWSVVEGNSTSSDIGFIDHTTGARKSSFYHYQMMAENFSGTYANGTTNNANVKAFGSKNGNQIAVMVMNQDMTTNLNFTVKLGTSNITAASPLKVNINAGLNTEYTDAIPAQSTVLLVFNASGAIIKKYEYGLNAQAANNQAPKLTQFNATGVAVQSGGEESGPEFEINKVYPNPTQGKFTVQLNKDNNEEREYGIEVFNMAGQLVMTQKGKFFKGKEIIDFTGLASAMYIVRVKYQDILKTEKVMLIK